MRPDSAYKGLIIGSILLRYCQGVARVLPGYCQGIPRELPGYCQGIARELAGYNQPKQVFSL